MQKYFDAYLDIETTGLSMGSNDITVIGIYLHNGEEERLIQLYGERVNTQNLLNVLDGVQTIYTYNGSRFDIPFIHGFLGINLEERFQHIDLMYHCWRHNLKGGFKVVEKILGIYRETEGVCGYDAIILWDKYENYDDMDALSLLLKYNRDDVVNLKTLREKLEQLQQTC
jgi:uncharacterized protein YprB with RNaseH-like and TPR domain